METLILGLIFVGGVALGSLITLSHYQKRLDRLLKEIRYSEIRKPGHACVHVDTLRGMYLAVKDSPNHEFSVENERALLGILQRCDEELADG